MRRRIIEGAMGALQKAAGLLMLAMVLVVTVQLIARNFLRASTPWTEDSAKLLLVWMTFIGAPVVLYKGEHLMVDLIYSHLRGWRKHAVDLLMVLIGNAFCIIVIRLGLSLCTNRIILRSVTAAAGIPRVWMFSALPTGGILMLLVAANHLIDTLFALFHKPEPERMSETKEG